MGRPEKRDQIHGKWGAATEAIAQNVIDDLLKLVRSGTRLEDVEVTIRMRYTPSSMPKRPAITYSGNAG